LERADFGEIFHRYLHNQCTPEEAQYVLDLLAAGVLSDTQIRLLQAHLLHEGQDIEMLDAALEQRLQLRLENIHGLIEAGESNTLSKKPTRYLFLRWVAAALVVLLAGSSFYYLQSLKRKLAVPPGTMVHQDIAPGGNKAMLTLANGTTVLLDSMHNGIVAQQGATHVVKLSNGQIAYNVAGNAHDAGGFNTMATPRGGQYQIVLPDGTRVWLNAASSLRYPVRFTGADRMVTLTGEAYFEVAADVQHPFKVQANHLEIQVLGTHFNVMAYDDEQAVNTTLLEGAVKVKNGKDGSILRPGQQGILDKESAQLLVKEVDVTQVIAWKDGYFQFDGIDLPALLRQISRWYDLEIVYEGVVPDHEFVGRISRTAQLSSVLKALQISDIHFRIEGKKLIVLPPA
jgi:transmembrane sensor